MTTPLTTDRDRAAFEAAISGPPYECPIERWPDDAARFAWPGQYKGDCVELAWCMWQEAAKQERAGRPTIPPTPEGMPELPQAENGTGGESALWLQRWAFFKWRFGD